MELSVVISAMDEAENLERLLPAMREALSELTAEYEIIVVDDGSMNGTYNTAKKYGAVVVHNEESLGKTKAMTQGFSVAKGRIIVMFDADFQEEPKEIRHFIRLIDQGYDLVNGWRHRRAESWGKRKQSLLYNIIIHLLTESELHDNNCGFKAFRREMVGHMNLSKEGYHRYMIPMLLKKGYKVCEAKVSHYPRQYGETKYVGLGRVITGFVQIIELKLRGEV